MLIWETADHILIDFQTVLSQKHIITCQSIYNAALVKNEQYSFFLFLFSPLISLKDEKQWENGESIIERHIETAPETSSL